MGLVGIGWGESCNRDADFGKNKGSEEKDIAEHMQRVRARARE